MQTSLITVKPTFGSGNQSMRVAWDEGSCSCDLLLISPCYSIITHAWLPKVSPWPHPIPGSQRSPGVCVASLQGCRQRYLPGTVQEAGKPLSKHFTGVSKTRNRIGKIAGGLGSTSSSARLGPGHECAVAVLPWGMQCVSWGTCSSSTTL